MNSIAAYKNGMRFLSNNKKLLWVLLLINISFALFIAMPINSYIDQSIGDSLSMKAFDNGFDYMLISDFLDNYGMGICLLYTSPSPRDQRGSRMPSSA